MKQRPMIMNIGNMVWQTERAKDYVADLIKRAKDCETDSRKKERLVKYECKACFYINGRIGGAAMTNRDCMSCGKTETYASTVTDVLCMDCAKEHNLCKHCGGDIEMKVRRNMSYE